MRSRAMNVRWSGPIYDGHDSAAEVRLLRRVKNRLDGELATISVASELALLPPASGHRPRPSLRYPLNGPTIGVAGQDR